MVSCVWLHSKKPKGDHNVVRRSSLGIGFVVALFLIANKANAQGWFNNTYKFPTTITTNHYRTSDHFMLIYGSSGTEYSRVNEALIQGNLQMLEHVWHVYHDPLPYGLGLKHTGTSLSSQYQDGKNYRVDLAFCDTGVTDNAGASFGGGAWCGLDSFGFPILGLPPSYLAYDPPSGATAHEYGHGVVNASGGIIGSPYDGMWHESFANWLMLQFNSYWPTVGNTVLNHSLSLPHGRDYYDAWPILEYLKEDPKYGMPFINSLLTGLRGSSGEYIFDAMTRLDTSGSVDHQNAIKDVIGNMAAHCVTWDFQRGQWFRCIQPLTSDQQSDFYRRGYNELVRQPGSTASTGRSGWYRIPWDSAPSQGGYDIIPIKLYSKGLTNYPVSVDFKPLWDGSRGSDWRATLVAVNDNGEPRYSTMWNSGINTINLSLDENKLYLVVAATPSFLPFDGGSHPLVADPVIAPQAYEVAFVNTNATAYETPALSSSGLVKHANGGGYKSASASVASTAYIGPNARVLGSATVSGYARIEDYAIVAGKAQVRDNAIVSGHALVKDSAQVYGDAIVRDWATIYGNAQVYEYGRALEHATVFENCKIHGNATIKGVAVDCGSADVSGYAIVEGDAANFANVDHQVLTCWVWGTDQAYADSLPDTGGRYCEYKFDKTSPNYAVDTFGIIHGYLMGNPRVSPDSDGMHGNVLNFNGVDQYVELRRDVSDFRNMTVCAWVKWSGTTAGDTIFSFGDGVGKQMYVTPMDLTTGNAQFVITNGATTETITANAPLPTNTWAHIAVTFSGNTATFYVNGVEVGSNTAMTLLPYKIGGANTASADNCNYIGRNNTGSYFYGQIDDFAVYATALSAADIQATKLSPNTSMPAPDTTAPTPNAATWLVAPTAVNDTTITMSATKGRDASGFIEYYFTCTSGGGHDSGWISSNRYTDCGLTPGTAYTYTVKMRDKAGNTTAASISKSATAILDTDPPTPNAATFTLAPKGVSSSSISMTATRGTDVNPLVEYKFNRIKVNGVALVTPVSSGWKSTATWTDTGLSANSTYTYTVQMRDGNGNIGQESEQASAVARDDTPPTRWTKGEWLTRPYTNTSGKVFMRAMSVNGSNNPSNVDARLKVTSETVQYCFFNMTTGTNSGWISTPYWTTPVLPAGAYDFRFKIRDTTRYNQTDYSSIETAYVGLPGEYVPYSITDLKWLTDTRTVTVTGTVSAIYKDGYYLQDTKRFGIKVLASTQLAASALGTSKTISGTLITTASGERAIQVL